MRKISVFFAILLCFLLLCSCEAIVDGILNQENPWHSESETESELYAESGSETNSETSGEKPNGSGSEVSSGASSENSSESGTSNDSEIPSQTPSESESELPSQSESQTPTSCNHEWIEATCKEPKHCLKCGTSVGKIGTHSWQNATCEKPSFCSVCDFQRGRALGHKWISATCEAPKQCERCEATDGDALGHTYEKTWTVLEDKLTASCTVCQNHSATAEKQGHDLVCSSFQGERIYKCTICPVALSPKDVIHLTFSDADGGYRVEVSAKFDGTHLNSQSFASMVRDENSTTVSILSQSFTFTNHWSENLDSVTELKIGDGVSIIETVSILPVKTIIIGTGVDKMCEGAIFSLENLNDVYFDGDLPEIEDDALWIYIPQGVKKTPTVWKNEGAKGFDKFGLFIHGSRIKTVGDKAPTVPNISIGEYASLSAIQSEKLALEIITEARKSKYYRTALIPQCDITEYKKIKDFALELTKNATSDKEKAEIIFDWIVDNIEYSNDALTYPVHTVFEKKMAVCAGYTGLMHDMLASVGIPSFYTRGIAYFDTPCTTEQMVNKEFEQYLGNTHAWVILVTSENEVITCDPTWGDFDISPEQMANTGRATSMLEGITVLPEGFDFSLYPSSVFYLENSLYSLEYGYITPFSGTGFNFNEFYDVTYSFHKRHDGITTSSTDLPKLNQAFFGDVMIYDGMKFGYDTTLFATATFNTVSFREVFSFALFEKLYYANDIDLPLADTILSTQDGTFYIINSDNTISVFGTCTQTGIVNIPESVEGMTVTEIYQTAFSNLTIKEVTLPSTVTKIGYHAFLNCDYIEEITLPQSVKQIEPGAFAYCDSLTSVTIYAGVEIIGFTKATTACYPTNLFDESNLDTISVYFVGTQDDFDKISFVNPWTNSTDEEQKAHIISLITIRQE